MDNLEQYYIQKFNSITPNGYNIMVGGQLKRSYPKLCKNCNKPLSDKTATYCWECYKIKERTIERPDREKLKDLIRNLSFVEIGKQYKVTDNAIRKWCKFENLPFRKKDINSYSDEEWNNI